VRSFGGPESDWRSAGVPFQILAAYCLDMTWEAVHRASALETHADLFKYLQRRGIVDMGERDEAVANIQPEEVAGQGGRNLGCVTASPELGCKRIAQFELVHLGR
jgi:hypothetical protein